MKYRLTVKTVSPLSVSARHPVVGQATPSLDYIPGTALRGACAMALLLRGESDTSLLFCSLFKNSAAVWGSLYPLNRIESDGPRRSSPIPLTALSCKRHPGFTNDPDGHGVRDSLIARLTGNGKRLLRCEYPNCDAPLDDFGGFYVIDTRQHQEIKPSRRLIARTAIAERWGTAQSGSLYALEALNEDQYFSGYLDLPDQCDIEIRKLLQPGAVFHIGTARRRGLGEVEVITCLRITEEPPELDKSLEDRVDGLDSKLHAHFQEERLWFALTLYADAILLDDYQRYQTVVTVEALTREARFWQVQMRWPTGLRLERTFSRIRRVSGWNIAHGLPRPDDLAIVAGSVAVFSAPRGSHDVVIDCLKLVEARGIGERIQEGFGRVIVSHPFHLQEDWL